MVCAVGPSRWKKQLVPMSIDRNRLHTEKWHKNSDTVYLVVLYCIQFFECLLILFNISRNLLGNAVTIISG